MAMLSWWRAIGLIFRLGKSQYEQISGRKAQVSHVPRAVLRTLSFLLRPFHPGLSQVMTAGSYFDEHGEFFDMAPTLQKYPMVLTPLETWARRRIGEV